jgi:hypothetical protein
MPDEVKPAELSESTDGKPEKPALNDEKKTDSQVQAIQGVERMPPHAEVVKKAELNRFADPNDPKDPKERAATDYMEVKKNAIEEERNRESWKKARENLIQGKPSDK